MAKTQQLLGALIFLAFGCREVPPPASPSTQPLTGNVRLEIGLKKLEVGEECTQFEGNTGCESDLCLRVAPGFPPKGFCTIKCKPGPNNGCPDAPLSWSCQQMFPTRDGWVCAPHKNHTSAKATKNGGNVPLPTQEGSEPQ